MHAETNDLESRQRPRAPRLAAGLMIASALFAGSILPAFAQDGKPVGGEFALNSEVTETVGPNGATGQPVSALTLSDEEVQKIKDGNFTAAMLFQTSSDWANAVTAGAQDEFKRLGIEVVALSNSNYSASDQAQAIKTILAKKPSGIVIWPINPDELRPALSDAVAAGSKIALISNMPSGFEQGKDYVGLVGDDLFGMGQKTAQGLANAIGGEGDIGFLYFDANAYVVNQRDAAFRTTIEREFPNVKITATQGFSDPQKVMQVASAMILQNPGLKGIYAPWSEPAAGVLQAIRAARRDDIAVATMDLSNTVALSLIQGGAIKALVVDDPYAIGKALATEIGFSLIDKEVPAYIQVPATPVTKDTLLQTYEDYHIQPPPEVTQALEK